VTHSGPKVLFKTCVAIKFVDDDDTTQLNYNVIRQLYI